MKYLSLIFISVIVLILPSLAFAASVTPNEVSTYADFVTIGAYSTGDKICFYNPDGTLLQGGNYGGGSGNEYLSLQSIGGSDVAGTYSVVELNSSADGNDWFTYWCEGGLTFVQSDPGYVETQTLIVDGTVGGGGGGGGDVPPDFGTSTPMTISDVVFGEAIIIFILSLGLLGYLGNAVKTT